MSIEITTTGENVEITTGENANATETTVAPVVEREPIWVLRRRRFTLLNQWGERVDYQALRPRSAGFWTLKGRVEGATEYETIENECDDETLRECLSLAREQTAN